MKTILSVLLFTTALPVFAKPFAEERIYTHHLFRTHKACMDAQNDHLWINCDQTIHLRPDGTASVVLTDIMNAATYELSGKSLVIHSTSPGDMANKMEFTLDSTERNLLPKDSPLQVWELEQPCE